MKFQKLEVRGTMAGKQPSFLQLGKKGIQRFGRFANVSYEKDPPQVSDFGRLLEKFSDDDIKVYQDEANKVINVSIRGSDFSSAERGKRDIVSDLKIMTLGIDNNDPRMFFSNRLVKTLKRAYPDYQIRTIGFSLGARIAQEITRNQPDVESVALNPASGLMDVIKGAPDNSKTIRVSGDPFSALAQGNVTTIQAEKNPLYAHALANLMD